jgi:aminoglycoside 6'-N-acetyltransferase I
MDRPDHLGQPVNIKGAKTADAADWAEMRQALWPNSGFGKHHADIKAALAKPRGNTNLIARVAGGMAVGFAEASLRHDYVNGCDTSPVAFLEGIYVKPEYRRQGIARQLIIAVEEWGRAQNCLQIASDTDIANLQSQSMHQSLGFSETQRVVFFRKSLVETSASNE